MHMSTEINELATALAKAQAEIRGAKEDGKNPHFKSTYATLSSVWDACREALTKAGLSVVQATTTTEQGLVLLVTTLLHSSGQWISGAYPVSPSKNDPQGLGSAMTYARRYTLASMIGIAPEDDDGEASLGRAPATMQKQAPVAAPPVDPDDKWYAFLGAMKAQKERLGEETYYRVLAGQGYKKSNEVPKTDWDKMAQLIRTLVQLPTGGTVPASRN